MYLCHNSKVNKMSSKVRVRFAPSPTGPLHIGGVRTALYNYLFAKNTVETSCFALKTRTKQDLLQEQKNTSLKPWPGVVFLLTRVSVGKTAETALTVKVSASLCIEYAETLLANDKAYIAFDTAEELEQVRALAKEAGASNWQYNYITRENMKNSLTLAKDEVSAKIAAGEPYVVRMKLPRDHEVRFEDTIRGWVSVNTNNMDDKVLFKGDGMPTYHLANIVDDHLMEISHVIRGEEWLPSAPLHVLLYEAFGWERPIFAHLPLL